LYVKKIKIEKPIRIETKKKFVQIEPEFVTA